MLPRQSIQFLLVVTTWFLLSVAADAHPGHDHAAPDGLSAHEASEQWMSESRAAPNRGLILIGCCGIVVAAVLVSLVVVRPTDLARDSIEESPPHSGPVFVASLILLGAILGGVSSTIVSWLALERKVLLVGGELVAVALTAVAGAFAIGGSAVGLAKLRGVPGFRQARRLPGHWILILLMMTAVAGLTAVLISRAGGRTSASCYAGIALLSLGIGAFQISSVLKEDVRIVAGLLLAAAGLAGTSAGFVIGHGPRMILGSLVAAAGIVMSRLAATAQKRGVARVLFGASDEVTASGGGR